MSKLLIGMQHAKETFCGMLLCGPSKLLGGRYEYRCPARRAARRIPTQWVLEPFTSRLFPTHSLAEVMGVVITHKYEYPVLSTRWDHSSYQNRPGKSGRLRVYT